MNIQSLSGNAVAPPPTRVVGEAQLAHQDATVTRATAAETTKAVEPTQQTSQAATREELNKAVEDMNAFVKSMNNPLQFSVDGDTGKTVVKVIDSSTKEVIKQFPSEEALTIAKALDKVKGLLVYQKA